MTRMSEFGSRAGVKPYSDGIPGRHLPNSPVFATLWSIRSQDVVHSVSKSQPQLKKPLFCGFRRLTQPGSDANNPRIGRKSLAIGKRGFARNANVPFETQISQWDDPRFFDLTFD